VKVIAIVGIALLLQMPSAAQQNVAQIPFDSVPDYPKLPDGMNLGEVSGVAVNSKGHVFVFTRSNSAAGPAYGPAAAQLLEFGPNGELIREIGKGLYGWAFAHTVRVDKDDNIWAVDKGSDMVIKFNPQGRVVWVFGRRSESADDEAKPWEHVNPPLPPINGRFRQPTDVAWDSQGNIYITDGYVNSRVAKYDKNGRFVKSVGIRGTQPYQFNTPHSITSDANGNIYVADRNNRRIQVFDSNLVLRAIYDHVGAPWAVCISPGPHQYLFSSNSNPDNNNSLLAAVAGEIYKMELDGTVIGKFGKPGKQLGEFSTVHAIDCRNPDELIVVEITAWRAQKIRLKPITPSSTR
jgi:DNA-binding beta-propeller fold protein YncE